METEVWQRWQLRANGVTDAEVRRLRRTGELGAIGAGAYTVGAPPTDAVAHHLLQVRAAAGRLDCGAVVSHVSAALVHGLPTWAVPLDRVHVSRDRSRSGARRGHRVHVHSAPMARDEVRVVNGLAVTSVERTLVDAGRTLPFEQVVVMADAALARRLVTPDSLAVALARRPRVPGLPAARRALASADGPSESVGESRSRVALAQAGLPPPTLQWPVRDGLGRLIGRTDFGWPELRTVGEFDGRAKYGRLLRPGQHPGDAVYAEKRREDQLRAEGLAVVRWSWADLGDFAPVVARLRNAFTTLHT